MGGMYHACVPHENRQSSVGSGVRVFWLWLTCMMPACCMIVHKDVPSTDAGLLVDMLVDKIMFITGAINLVAVDKHDPCQLNHSTQGFVGRGRDNYFSST